MEKFKGALFLAASVSILMIGACSSGGGGGGTTSGGTTTGGTTTGGTTTGGTTTTPSVTISAPNSPNVGGTQISTSTTSFTANPPLAGTQFKLGGSAMVVSSTSVTPESGATGADGVVTFDNQSTLGPGVFPKVDLSIPSLSVNVAGMNADGTVQTQADGSKVTLKLTSMNYTLLGNWVYTPASGSGFVLGQGATGIATPQTSVPTTGTAVYNNSSEGGVVGTYYVPGSSGTVASGTLSGNATVNVNFATGNVTGTLSNMTSNDGATTSPWNSVSLTGNVVLGSQVSGVKGTTATTGAPSGASAAGMSSAATGAFTGGFFGPNADEIGAGWTLSETTTSGGKAAFGTFGAAK